MVVLPVEEPQAGRYGKALSRSVACSLSKRGNVHYFGSGAGAMKHTGINAQYEGLLGVHEGHYGFVSHCATAPAGRGAS